MKNLFSLLVLLCIGLSMQSCIKDDCDATRNYVYYEPIYKKAEEFRIPITTETARQLENPGKIYYYKNYIFINEINEGVHIVDNTNPEQPDIISFINIPGNVDMAIRDEVLYADNYVDLLALDITDVLNPKLLQRHEEALLRYYWDNSQGYFVGYSETNIIETIDCTNPNFGRPFFNRGGGILVDIATAEDASFDTTSGDSSKSGTGGSLARFTIYQHYLYTIGEFEMDVYDISIRDELDAINTIQVGWGIETLYPYKDKLFIGANDGLYIFDNQEPTRPELLAKFQHARACDPVVVEDDIAYVTLRDGNACQGFNNQLDIVDVSDFKNPSLIESHPMEHPHGLSVRDKVVYLCEGEYGLKVLDLDNPKRAKKLSDYSIATYDNIVIPGTDIMLVIGKDGLYQYDISDNKNLKQLSFIPVGK